jgi:hypothetical protein
MFLEVRKFELRFIDDLPYLYDDEDEIITLPDSFGYVYNKGPLHDHNFHWKDGVFLENLPYDFYGGIDREVSVIVLEICPIHIGKDCNCQSGLDVSPRLFNGKIILDLYDIINNNGEDDYYFN